MIPELKLDAKVMSLPRGGYLIETSAGSIQFGAPPETIKDTMKLERGVPSVFVLPGEFFNWTKGISIAELEFPIYYNYFIKKKKTLVICNRSQSERFERVLRESLFGPVDADYSADFTEDADCSKDIRREMAYFRSMQFSDVVRFGIFAGNEYAMDGITIKINQAGDFEVFEGKSFTASVPGKIDYTPRYRVGERLREAYRPPLFAMTCLGSSSGFDPDENTSGFVLWLNRYGVMIDPPVNSTEWLLDSNVSPKFIDGIILTHCHADHDAGTFQKILEEGKVTIYTTRNILMSFLGKYSALADVSADYLMSLFNFKPIVIGKPVFIRGARFDFFHALHSIPSIGFRVEFQGRSITYSSDHNNDPALHKMLLDSGVIGGKRYESLCNFPWNSTVVYHESGIPPLHTPLERLYSLPAETREKLIVYHIPRGMLDGAKGIRIAGSGMENTVVIDVEPPAFEKTYQILALLRHLDFSEALTLAKAQDFVASIEEKSFSKGEVIIRKGAPGDRFYMIYSGNVSITGEDRKYSKLLGAHDYFGEAAVIKGERRSADVVAETDVILYSIEKECFLDLIEGTEYAQVLYRLASNRDREAWEILSTSRFVRFFTSTQRTWLESIISPAEAAGEGNLVNEGARLKQVYIIREGRVDVIRSSRKIAEIGRGDLVGHVADIYEDNPSRFTFHHPGPVLLYSIRKNDFNRFLRMNPGLIKKMEYNYAR